MKPSDAMLKGFEKVGRQCRSTYFEGLMGCKPEAVCAFGAAFLALAGNAERICASDQVQKILMDANEVFKAKTGESISQANDSGMSIPDIAGILAAEGY